MVNKKVKLRNKWNKKMSSEKTFVKGILNKKNLKFLGKYKRKLS